MGRPNTDDRKCRVLYRRYVPVRFLLRATSNEFVNSAQFVACFFGVRVGTVRTENQITKLMDIHFLLPNTNDFTMQTKLLF